MAPNELYQYSTLNALMEDVYHDGIPVSAVSKSGNHGLGTFKDMDGEMVIIDSTVYQMQAGGTIAEADPNTPVPFVQTTNFSPTITKEVPSISKDGLTAALDELAPKAKNHFISVRMDGVFDTVTARTVAKKTPEQKGRSLAENQVVKTWHGVKGTLIGFRSPEFSQGLSVAGSHIHLISEDRKMGGHVLDFQAHNIKLQIAVIKNMHLELPENDEFAAAKLVQTDEDIKAVEG
ncbi:hypothetical protein M8818_000446 [Zalaria obscura]|uniref:Uncharacterized protein n=1 Tax=Zalaria obscura TaxID=2024903 RepID=A0ACC3SQG5_9PEZI